MHIPHFFCIFLLSVFYLSCTLVIAFFTINIFRALFVIFLGETGSESAHVVFSKLQEQIVDSFDKNRWPVTLSIGVVTYNKPPETVDEILRKRDSLMYSAKISGKNSTIYESVY